MSDAPGKPDLARFERSIARIRVNFVDTLAAHEDELRRLFPMIYDQRSTSDSIPRISEIAHKIHGVARTLHFAELGRVAARVERETAGISPASLPAQEIDRIAQSVVDLIDTIALARDEACGG